MILENRNSVKISDMPNEIRSVSIGAFDMIADFCDLGECYCWKTFFWLIPFIPLFCYSWKIKIPELLWNSGIYIVLLSLKVVPPGIEHLKFFVLKVLINSTKSYIVKIKTIELAIFLISIISIFIAVIFLTVQRYGKGSIPPNSIGIKLQKTL